VTRVAKRVGIAGLGAAGSAFIAPLHKHPGFEWVAVADTVPAVRDAAQRDHGVAVYASFEALLEHPGLDAVLITTPTPLHAEQACAAAGAGLHVLLEKPMAVDMASARRVVDVAERAGIALVLGHSHSFDAPMRAMRKLIVSGELGPVRMVQHWCFSDWMRRPRQSAELDAAQGGGVTLRQGSHQFDVLRLLCGGMARSVRARVFDWDATQRGIGAHQAFIDFDGDVGATAVYNGYGGFSTQDLCFDISEWGLHQPPGQRPPPQRGAIPAAAPFQPMFGLVLVSCERGDIRQSAQGLLVHTPGGAREVAVPLTASPRELVLQEWFDAIEGKARALHDGRWGLANLELCLAVMESSRSAREVTLHEQVPLRDMPTA
jgi:phthalate 4,5-cis-dihydrodiol dehydrogenase